MGETSRDPARGYCPQISEDITVSCCHRGETMGHSLALQTLDMAAKGSPVKPSGCYPVSSTFIPRGHVGGLQGGQAYSRQWAPAPSVRVDVGSTASATTVCVYPMGIGAYLGLTNGLVPKQQHIQIPFLPWTGQVDGSSKRGLALASGCAQVRCSPGSWEPPEHSPLPSEAPGVPGTFLRCSPDPGKDTLPCADSQKRTAAALGSLTCQKGPVPQPDHSNIGSPTAVLGACGP